MRTEDKVINNGKLQAKQEKIKSLHCPSPQSSLFNSRGSSLNTRFPFLVSHSLALNPDQSTKPSSFNPQHSKESAAHCTQQSSECVARCLQHNDELAARSPQHLFIDVSTELLRQGQSVRFRAPGLSMHPAIKEGETITVVPISPFDIKRGDILLYLIGKKVVAHRVVSIKRGKNDSASHSARYSTNHSSSHSSANSSIPSSTHSKTLNPQLIFILRGDASAACDNPVEAQQILGKVVSVEKNGRSIDLYSRKANILRLARACASRLKRWMIRIFLRLRGLFHWARLICHRFRQRMFDSKDSIKGVQK